jgi:hypothetical protein
MTMSEKTATRANRKKPRLWHILLGLLGVLVLAFGIFRVVLRAQVRSRIDAVRAAGYPITPRELDGWYQIPPFTANAADYIAMAFPCMKLPEHEAREPIPLLGTASLPPRSQPLDANTVSLLSGLLVDNAKALELLHQSAVFEQSRYPIDCGEGLAVLLPHLGNMSTASRLLALEAILHAQNNEREASIRSIASAYGVARSLRGEPITISQMVRHSCAAIATQALEQVLNRTRFTDEQLAQLERTIGAAYDPNAMARALVGERCFGHDVFRHPRALGLDTWTSAHGPSLVAVEAQRALGLLDRSWALYLDLMEEFIEAAQLPPGERCRVADAIATRHAAVFRRHDLLSTLMPSPARLIRADVEGLAHLLVAQTALAVERYRLASGGLPSRLEDLAPTYILRVPPDPFDGRPLRYRRLPTGYVVYSIGRDEVDDNGRERPPRRRSADHPTFDLTFTVER